MSDDFDHIEGVNVAEPVFGIQVGKANVRIHRSDACAGRHCPFHNPSEHALKDAPMNIRFDRRALVERMCPHGIGHSDPDSAAYLDEAYGETTNGVHGCDGCC